MFLSRLIVLGLVLAILDPTAAFCRSHLHARAVSASVHPKPLPWAKPGWTLTFHDEVGETALNRQY